jgi:hypothetical protein
MLCLAACKIVVPNAFENSSQHSGSLDPTSNEEENRVRGGGNRVVCVGTFVYGFIASEDLLRRFRDSTTVCEILCSQSLNDGNGIGGVG